MLAKHLTQNAYQINAYWMKICRTSLHKHHFYKARNSSELTGFSCFLWLFTFYVSVKNCVCFYESCLIVQFCVLSLFSSVRLFMTPWTVAHKALLSVGFSKQEYWSGLLCPPPGDLPHPGIEPMSLMSPTLAGEFYTTSTTWKALGHVSDAKYMFVSLYADEQGT